MIRRTLYTVPDSPKEVRAEFLREANRAGVEIIAERGELFLAEKNAPNLVWATDYTKDAFEVEVPSINQGAKNLREAMNTHFAGIKGARWVLLPGENHRRASLIAEALRAVEPLALPFPVNQEKKTAGFFLLNAEKAVAVFDSLTPYPAGGIIFAEEKIGPPSRAYLKIWEALTRIDKQTGIMPRKAEQVVDLGSCPGGWTWALGNLGCEVVSIDGAPLELSVSNMPGVHFLKKDAFKLKPAEILAIFPDCDTDKIGWVFSDMICEPKRLPDLLRAWLDSGVCERFVFSVKFKGEADLATLRELEGLGGGKLRHLRQNKHELTWFRIPGLEQI